MPQKGSAEVQSQNSNPQSSAIVLRGDAQLGGRAPKRRLASEEPQTRIPRPQIVRIQMRHVAGQSNREIARAEGRDRGTIAKIVKSAEMATFVEEMKERFRGLAPVALETIENALRVQQDARVAYQVLSDLGVTQSKGEQPQQPVMATEEELLKEEMTRMAYILGQSSLQINEQVYDHADLEDFRTALGEIESELLRDVTQLHQDAAAGKGQVVQ